MRNFRSIHICLVIFCLTFSSANSSENEWESINSSLTVGVKTGHITFQIGGLVSDGERLGRLHFPISELKFPTNFEIAQLSVNIKARTGWDVLFQMETNVSKDAGTLEDRDWLAPGRLDTYSDTHTSLSSKEFIFETAKELTPIKYSSKSLYNKFGFGLLGQFYKYTGFNTIQSYPSSDLDTIFLDGDTIKFDFSQLTPFASYLVSHNLFGNVNVDLKLLFSPLMFIRDKDQHLLRNKHSTSKTRGWFFHTSLNMLWKLNQSFAIFTQTSFQKFEANGNQTQNFEDNPDLDELKVKVKHLGQQINLTLGLNYQF